MPYVTIHRDITKVKTKLALNLTKRQLICFGLGIAAGVPCYFLASIVLDTSSSVLVMMAAMFPFFIFAMYERDGQPLETVLRHILTAAILRPKIRMYKPVNLYAYLEGGGGALATAANQNRKPGVLQRLLRQLLGETTPKETVQQTIPYEQGVGLRVKPAMTGKQDFPPRRS